MTFQSGELSRSWDTTASSAAEECRLPESENDEVLAQFLFCRFADLSDALFRDAEFGGDHVERDLVEVITAENVRVIGRESGQGGLNVRVRVARFGSAGRAQSFFFNEHVNLIAVGVFFVGRADVGRRRETIKLRERIERKSSDRRQLPWRG